MEFIWPVRVYYEDTDSGGVVYHSNYLNFMEWARTEWLRALGLEQDEIINKYGIVFVVSSLSINYLKPALFNDALQVRSSVKKCPGPAWYLSKVLYVLLIMVVKKF